MILGTGPTAQSPVDFTPPQPGGGNIPKLPHTGFYSGNIWPFSQVMGRMHAFPAYRPNNFQPNNYGLQPMPPIAPPAPAAAPMAPAPGTTPAGTAGAFGGSGFGSSGGVRSHSHSMSPYAVMRSGQIPNIHPNGSNIRSGYKSAGMRVHNSMPFQSYPLPPDAPPPPPPPPTAMAPAGAPMPAATHGFGSFSWNPLKWFSKRTHSDMVSDQMKGAFGASNCEWVGPRMDGTKVQICNGHVVQVADAQGNVLYNAYNNPDAY